MNETTVGYKIKEIRNKKHLSQAEFANLLSISKQAVGKWERNESLPDIIMLNKIANIFETTLNYFSLEKSEGVIDDYQLVLHNMSFYEWRDADFRGLGNISKEFNSAHITNCKFNRANFIGVKLKSNNIKKNDFKDANMVRCIFKTSNIKDNIFHNAKLNGSIFKNCNIEGNDFNNADFSNTLLENCNFAGNLMITPSLASVEFKNCNLRKIDFVGTFTNCSFVGNNYSRVRFIEATLNNVFFKSRNMKKVVFINCQVDRLTYQFLKQARVDLKSITISDDKTN